MITGGEALSTGKLLFALAGDFLVPLSDKEQLKRNIKPIVVQNLNIISGFIKT